MTGKNNHNRLSKKEQATTTAYKLMCQKVNTLEKSLKKIQDESEKIRAENYELGKKNVLLESNLKKQPIIEILIQREIPARKHGGESFFRNLLAVE